MSKFLDEIRGSAIEREVEYKFNEEITNMEKILCSAIKRLEQHPNMDNTHTEVGSVCLGYRHHDILICYEGLVSKKLSDQGFFTSKGRFVDREEAYVIAEIAGQLIEKAPHGKQKLFSEMLY